MKQKSNTFSRSEWAFIRALVELLKTIPFDSVRITALLELSGYSRNAFYHRYEDKYDFATKIFEHIIHQHVMYLDQFTELRLKNASFQEQLNYSCQFFSFIYEHRDLYELILDNKLGHLNCDFFCKTAIQLINQTEKKDSYKISQECDIALFQYISLHDTLLLIRYWRENNYQLSTEYMAKQSFVIIRENLFYSPEKFF